MELTSPAFVDNERFPSAYTCDGDEISPPLVFHSIPAEAKSLALILDDPDAPGSSFIHWTLWNIPAREQDVATGEIPPGAREGKNTAGGKGYVSPCPPTGTHRYVFTLFALDAELGLPAGAAPDELRRAMEGHIVEETKLTGLYSRS
jgi:hypothetical protein